MSSIFGQRLPPRGLLPDPTHPLMRGLDAWWLMNEGSAAIARDYSRQGRLFVTVDPSWAPSEKGPVPTFNGVNNRFLERVADPEYKKIYVYQNSLEFTLSAWIKTDNASARQTIFGTAHSADDKGFLFMWETYGAEIGSKTPRFAAFAGSQNKVIDANGPDNVFDDNDWHHIAVAGRGAGNNIFFFVDGSPVTSSYSIPYAFLSSGDSTRRAAIGMSHGELGAILPFDGSICDVRCYHRGLSDKEMYALYARPYEMFKREVPVWAFEEEGAPPTVKPVYLGSSQIDKMYLGSTEIQKAYLGNTEVFDKG